MDTNTRTAKAVELVKVLGKACELLTDMNSQTTDDESTALYSLLRAVSDARMALTEDQRLAQCFDRQAVADAAVA